MGDETQPAKYDVSMAHSVAAGMFISLGAMFSMSVAQYGPLAQGLCFSTGLFGVITGGAQLFTGSVTKVLEVWCGRMTYGELAGKLHEVWLANLLACVLMALLAHAIGYDASAVAAAKASMPVFEMFARAILCNVLVCMAVLVGSFEETAGGVLLTCIPFVACFVACGFEHSVADMFYMTLGWADGAVGIVDLLRVILVATLGNVVGGVLLTRLLVEFDYEGE